ncbi:hypothetical protein TWF718_001552 [Orbilia javanica]|uniref:Uncharacterized protein n=1 Tax=Orbilia javanica TaxID=47235 RepID=A0AAN8NHX1_9PEZI
MDDLASIAAEVPLDYVVPANQSISSLVYPGLQSHIDEARLGIIEQRIGLIGQRIHLGDCQDLSHQIRFNGIECVLGELQTQSQENTQKLEIEIQSCLSKIDSRIEPIFGNFSKYSIAVIFC